MQFPFGGKPPLGVVYDSALGSDIGDVLAMALLYGFDGKNEARVVALSTTKHNLKSAAFADLVARFYAGAADGSFGFSGRALPVGLATTGIMPEDTPMLAAPLSRPTYSHGVRELNDTSEPAAMIRNAYTSQQDGNCVSVLTGPATNFAAVLGVAGAKDWIERKSKLLVVGASPAAMRADLKAARKLFAEWPGQVVFAGPEVGEVLPFPGAAIEKDFAWAPAHPVVDAYRAFKAMPYDAPASAMAAMLYAVKPNDKYFQLSSAGTLSVGDDGVVGLAPGAGRHQLLVVDPGQKERVVKTYVEVASAKPVPRVRRFRPPVKNQTPPAKPPETPPRPSTP